MTRAPALVLVALLPLVLTACESTAAKSARIARAGHKAVQATGRLRIARPNADVSVRRAVVVRGAGGASAAVVELRNAGRRAQADVPVLIDVRDGRGTSVYRNDLEGLQHALQHVGAVAARRSVWWVDDQLLGAQAPRSVRVKVGPGRSVGAVPRVLLRGVRFDGDATGRFLTGVIEDRAGRPLRDVAIFAVALRGRRVVAAGRALIPKLVPRPKRPTVFRVFFVGEPRGARLVLTVAPPLQP